jgi:tRNA pseudouridine55 synthase
MNATPRPPAPSGVLLVDKPAGLTSHDVVARVRRAAHTRKVGHAGTLDPMATGLLILGIGSSTRLLTYIVGADKEYEATIRLGQSTTTDDAEGEPAWGRDPRILGGSADTAIRQGILKLTGQILQVPSSVSAIKVDGKRAYARVREGEQVELSPRPVTVSEFAVTGPERTVLTGTGRVLDLDVRVRCSSGTYIRALARDLGDGLGVGGHLTRLRRTRIGPFAVSEAVPLGDLEGGVPVERVRLSPAEAATRLLGDVRLTPEQARDLGHGKRIGASAPPGATSSGPFAAIAPDGRLVGLVEFSAGQGRTVVNFPPDDNGTGADA